MFRYGFFELLNISSVLFRSHIVYPNPFSHESRSSRCTQRTKCHPSPGSLQLYNESASGAIERAIVTVLTVVHHDRKELIIDSQHRLHNVPLPHTTHKTIRRLGRARLCSCGHQTTVQEEPDTSGLRSYPDVVLLIPVVPV